MLQSKGARGSSLKGREDLEGVPTAGGDQWKGVRLEQQQQLLVDLMGRPDGFRGPQPTPFDVVGRHRAPPTLSGDLFLSCISSSRAGPPRPPLLLRLGLPLATPAPPTL